MNNITIKVNKNYILLILSNIKGHRFHWSGVGPGRFVFKAPWECHVWPLLGIAVLGSLYFEQQRTETHSFWEKSNDPHLSPSCQHTAVVSKGNGVQQMKSLSCGPSSVWWSRALKLGGHGRCVLHRWGGEFHWAFPENTRDLSLKSFWVHIC